MIETRDRFWVMFFYTLESYQNKIIEFLLTDDKTFYIKYCGLTEDLPVMDVYDLYIPTQSKYKKIKHCREKWIKLLEENNNPLWIIVIVKKIGRIKKGVNSDGTPRKKFTRRRRIEND